MANTISFTGAFIRTVAMALDEGTKRIRINVTANLTKEVREKMDWREAPKMASNGRFLEDAATCIDLEGELHGRTMTLTPSNGELAKLAFSIDISEVKSFQLVIVRGENSVTRELRFQVLSVAQGALGAIETYTDAIGQDKGTLKVSYVKQQELDLGATGEAEEDAESVEA